MGNGLPEGRPLVLVVEDEAIIRLLLVDELEGRGFAVAEAGSADAALPLLGGAHGVAAVVTDVRLPGRLDGLALVRWIGEHAAGVPVVITLGYVAAEDAAALNPAVAGVFAKPYNVGDVVALVAASVGGDRG